MEKENEQLKELVAQVREAYAEALMRWAEDFGKDTSSGKSYLNFSEDIRAKKPVKINGPIDGDILDAILQAPPFNLGSGYMNPQYQAIWKALEEGV